MNRFVKVVSESKFWVSLVAVALSAMVLLGVDKEKQSQATALILSIGGLAAVVIGSMGYEQGKLNEGTIPEGSTPAPPKTVVVPMLADEQTINMGSPGGHPETTASPPGSGETGTTPNSAPRTGPRLGLVALVIFPLFAMLAGGGCAQTSPAFIQAVKQTVPEIADAYSGYVKADRAIDAPARATRTQDAADLKAAAQADNVTVDRVDKSWQRVRGPYLHYIQSDPTNGPPEIELFSAEVGRLDRLIAEEKSRRGGLFGTGENLPPLGGPRE